MKTYTVEQAAETLQISKRLVRTEVHKGRLKVFIVGEQKWRFTEEALQEYAADRLRELRL